MPLPTDYPFAYQPVLDGEGRIFAFSVIYKNLPARDEDAAIRVTRIAKDAFLERETGDSLGGRKALVSVDHTFLESGMVSMLPASKTILELADVRDFPQDFRDLCIGYRRMGYTLALGTVVPAHMAFMIDTFDIVKLDVAVLSPEELSDAMRMLDGRPVKTLAENVNSYSAFEQCKALGFDLYQGHYFAQLGGETAPQPRRTRIQALLSMLENDASYKRIERTLKSSPELISHLLWLAHPEMPGTVGSVRDLLNMFGRSKLVSLLQELLPVSGESDRTQSLFELAVRRGRIIEALAQDLTHLMGASRREKGYMTGVLSLTDVLMHAPVDEVLPKLGVDGEILEAILSRGGMLGQLLRVCEALETADFDALSALAAACGMHEARIMDVQRAAMRWAVACTSATAGV
jgi:EAL and modified HD-GYP domain-containing signal transduction protein